MLKKKSDETYIKQKEEERKIKKEEKEKHKVEKKLKDEEIITCECGGSYQPYSKSRHDSSKKHQKFISLV